MTKLINLGKIDSVVFDVDGVILDFHQGFLNASKVVLDKELTEVTKSYNLCKRYNITEEEKNKIWKYVDEVEIANFPLIKGADLVFNYFKEIANVSIVTGIYEKSKIKRIENLEKYGINIEEKDIYCVETGTSSKRKYLQSLNPQIFFDDRLQHLNESEFIPYRVWVNHNDEQHGFEKHETMIETKSIQRWFNANKKTLDKINNLENKETLRKSIRL